MLVSESHRFIFVHVQKTAGTSITEVLRPLSLAPSAGRIARLGSDLGLVRDWRRYHFRKHAPLRRAERVLPPEVFASFYKFAFVRNPWDKVVSHYHYRVRTNRTGIADEGLSFRDWVLRSYGERDHRYHDEPKMFMPQVYWVGDAQGRCIIDFVGRFERLSEDFAEVCRRIGVDASLPHVKTTSHAHYRESYDDETRAVVAERFAPDLAEYGYTF